MRRRINLDAQREWVGKARVLVGGRVGRRVRVAAPFKGGPQGAQSPVTIADHTRSAAASKIKASTPPCEAGGAGGVRAAVSVAVTAAVAKGDGEDGGGLLGGGESVMAQRVMAAWAAASVAAAVAMAKAVAAAAVLLSARCCSTLQRHHCSWHHPHQNRHSIHHCPPNRQG